MSVVVLDSPLSSSTPLDEHRLGPELPPENFTHFVDFWDREKSHLFL